MGLAAVAAAADAYTPPTSDAFVRGIRGYPYAAATPRRDKIRAGVPLLKRCMSSAEVRDLIGNPDFGYIGYQNGPGGRVPEKRLWAYILVKLAATETEPGSRVVIWFDNDLKLQGVTVHGAPDIESNVSRRPQPCI
jgi:hypothetical protein